MAVKAKPVKRPHGVTLIGLPGVRRKKVRAYAITSVTQAVRYLRERQAITAANDEGALVVHLDDAGVWRCEFMRYLRTINASQFKHIAVVAQWLKEWMPQMKREGTLA